MRLKDWIAYEREREREREVHGRYLDSVQSIGCLGQESLPGLDVGFV